MGVGRFLLGTLELALLVLGVVAAARAARTRLLPDWDGPHAVLASTVLWLGMVTVALQLVAVVGLLRGWVLAVVGGLLLLRFGRPAPLRSASATRTPRSWRSVVTVTLVAGVVAGWLREVASVLSHGVLDVDSLGYHVPFALEWAQTHRVGAGVRVSPGTPVQFYPGNAELLHAATMVAYGRDVLGPYLNLGWLALLLLSAVCLGSRRNRILGVVAVALVIAGGPLIAKFLPGAAMTDMAALACVLAAAALLVETFDAAVVTAAALWTAGVATGMAVGIKLTVLPLIGALTLGLLLVRAVRGTPWFAFVGGLLVPSLFWYVRDLVLTGSPVPFLSLPGLPAPRFTLFAMFPQSVLHYLTDRHVLRSVFVPEAYQVLGPAWWLLGLLFVGGCGYALRGRLLAARVLGAAALIGGIAYLVTPTTAGGPEGHPFLYAVDLRYALPSLLLGGVLLVLLVGPRASRLLEMVLVVAVLATLFAPWRLTALNDQRPVVVAAVMLVAAVAAALPFVRVTSPVLVVGGVLLCVAALPGFRYALDHAYHDDRSTQAIRYFRSTTALRIGITGEPGIAAFAGEQLGNRLTYLGRTTPQYGFEEFTDCRAWRRAVAAGRFDAIVVARGARLWVHDPAFTQVVPQEPAGAPQVLLVTGKARDSSCPS